MFFSKLQTFHLIVYTLLGKTLGRALARTHTHIIIFGKVCGTKHFCEPSSLPFLGTDFTGGSYLIFPFSQCATPIPGTGTAVICGTTSVGLWYPLRELYIRVDTPSYKQILNRLKRDC